MSQERSQLLSGGSPFEWEEEADRPLRPMGPVVLGDLPEPADLPALPRERPSPEPETEHFVEFSVIDDATGEPLAGVELLVRLPSGALERAETDANGLLRFQGIPPGSCGLEDLAGAEFEVVGMT